MHSYADHTQATPAREPLAVHTGPRKVAILVYPGVQSLDIAGPQEVFVAANSLLHTTDPSDHGYEVRVLSRDGAPLRCSSGLTIVPDGDCSSAPSRLDTLILAGGYGSREASLDRVTLDWIERASARARRTASVCTGAFLLAAAGLLDGRRATTHWGAASELARLYPSVEVDSKPIFLRDGPIWTSAGVTAGMDLALALVEEDLSRDLALAIARHLVLFLRRPGNQSQFSATLAAQEPAREPLREVRRHILEHIADDLSVEALADVANMSSRHFARSFSAETGVTPARYVESVRLEAARRALEDTNAPIATVAEACGFGTPETMRRSFLRALGVAPAEYRRRFHPLGDASASTAVA
ncbi:MAG TPA: DJ-1/PfpI family protein [Solirubrobacteraceae bacterium]|jgi:transcriptional regulator GlxA family with amidase domain